MCLANDRKPDDSTTSTSRDDEEDEEELVGAACIAVGALRAGRVVCRRRTASTLPRCAVVAIARLLCRLEGITSPRSRLKRSTRAQVRSALSLLAHPRCGPPTSPRAPLHTHCFVAVKGFAGVCPCSPVLVLGLP